MIRTRIISAEMSMASVALLVAGLTGLLATTSSLLAIALPLALMLAVALYAWPVFGVFLFAATIPLETALTFGGVTSSKLIGVAVFGVWGAQKLLRRESLFPLVSGGPVRFAGLLLGLACLSLAWAEFPGGVRGSLILLFQLILLSIVVQDLASSWDRIAWVAKLLVLAGTVAALLTIEQYFFGGARRAGGDITGGINRTALTLVLLVPLAFYLLRSSETVAWRLLGLIYVGAAGLAIIATMSRMNLILYPLVVVAHLGLMARSPAGRRRVFLVGVSVLVAGLFVPMDAFRARVATIAPYMSATVGADEAAATVTTRGYLLRLGLAMFMDRPLLGQGYDNYGPQVERYQFTVPGAPPVYAYRYMEDRVPHSSHIYILANLGLVGFMLWMGVFVAAFRSIWRAWQTTRHSAGKDLLLVQAIAVAVVLLFAFGMYKEIHQFKIVWLLFGLTVAIERLPGLPTSRSRERGRESALETGPGQVRSGASLSG